MNLFQDETRARLITQDSDSNSKLCSFSAFWSQIDLDQVSTGGSRLPANQFYFALDFDDVTTNGLDGRSGSRVDFSKRRRLGGSKFAGFE